MKKLLMVIPLVFLFCFTFSCQKGEEVAEETATDITADVEAIKDLTEEWNVAFNAADIDRLVSFYTHNAVRIPPNYPALIGKEAIRGWFQQIFDQFTWEGTIIAVDVQVCGDLAFARGTWTGIVAPKAGGESLKPIGNWVTIHQKQLDGSWKAICEIWSDESLVSPPPEKE